MRPRPCLNWFAPAAVLALILGCDDGSGPKTAAHPTAAHLAFVVQPWAARFGVPFTPPVVVSINDANNRVLPVDSEVHIYLTGGFQGNASWGGTTSVRAVQGIATFDDLYVAGAGSGYALSAVSTGIDTVISDTFSVRFTPTITYNSQRILFDQWEVYGTRLDDTVKVNLTHDPANDGAGQWSPDGARFLVESDRTGNRDLYTLDSNALALTNLTRHAGNDYAGTWFPDGRRIAFLSDRDHAGAYEIYVMNADGSGQTRLTFDSAAAWQPKVSRDGAQIMFASRKGSTYTVYVMGADGGNRIVLAADTAPSGACGWSPRGDRMAFNAGGHLILSQPDGSNRIEIVGDTVVDPTRAFAGCAVFSPDGSRLAFLWYPGAPPPTSYYVSTLEVSNIDGTGVKPLLKGSLGLCEWSPDGAWIVYEDGLESWSQVFLVKPDGSAGITLTWGGREYCGSFRP